MHHTKQEITVVCVINVQKSWTSLEWMCLDRCTTSGRTRSAFVPTAVGASPPRASPRTWRSAWAWAVTAAASPTAGTPRGDPPAGGLCRLQAAVTRRACHGLLSRAALCAFLVFQTRGYSFSTRHGVSPSRPRQPNQHSD